MASVQLTVLDRADTGKSKQVLATERSYEMSTDSVLEFLDDRALCGRRKSTIDRYRAVLDRLGADTGKDPLKVTYQELKQYLAAWRNDHSANGAAFILRHVRAYYRWALQEGYLRHDPTDRLVIKPQSQPMLTAEDDAITSLLTLKGRKRADLRDRALLHLLVSTGARRSEIGRLTINDLQLDDCLIVITRSKTVARFVPITEEAALHVRRWLRVRPAQGTNLWVSNDGPALVGRVLSRRSDHALTPHAVRRWFATSWLTRGGSETSLARILGWSSTAMAAVYTRATAHQVAVAEYGRVFDHPVRGDHARLASTRPNPRR